MNELLEVFPFIKKTMLDLEQQNKFLNKVTLTGKINALDVAANLFEFTDKTAIIFDELKVELIEALLKENINKITNELSFKAKTAIDILIRNLFERTADIGFFATDSLLCEYLVSDTITDEQILKHLQEYASKYSVYNEIIVFDTFGNVKVNINPNNIIKTTQDSIIKEALSCDTYIERFAKTDIFKTQEKTLTYVQKIVHNGENVGVLCLCFKFEDEMQSIFKSLAQNDEIISINYKAEILASNHKKRFPKQTTFSKSGYQVIQGRYICVEKTTSGYQDYRGIEGWFAQAIIDTSHFSKIDTKLEEHSLLSDEHSKLLNQELKLIIEKANDIIEDISDVIINGELIASKQKVYVLTPILENLRNISTELLISIKTSIKNLEHVVEEGLVHDVKMASHLAVDIMDRNLYERANDCRWWALTPSFKKELSSESPNREVLQDILLHINELYTVYTNIFIYDAKATIIASSKDETLIGTQLHEGYITKTLQNRDSQKYYVSDFIPTSLYNGSPTYIYGASIIAKSKTVGGIGVVFDAAPEFKAMLNESFPQEKRGFMVFIDQEKKIISSNNSSLKILERLDIDDKFVSMNGLEFIYDYIVWGEKEYILASVPSQGYREYKTQDNYKNNIYCLTFVEL